MPESRPIPPGGGWLCLALCFERAPSRAEHIGEQYVRA